MSLHTAINLPPPPQVKLEREHGAATKAVLRYFECAASQGQSFDHLVAICSRAVRPLYLCDPDGEVTVKKTPQFNSIDGQRTGYDVRVEGTEYAFTRQWIQTWLLGFLARYHGKSREELIEAADNDEFRYIGRLCRLRLLDALDSQKAAKNFRPPHVSLDSPITADGGKLLDCYGTVRQDAPSFLSTGVSFEDVLGCISNVFRIVTVHREELARLGLLDGLRAILTNADHLETCSLRRFNARVIHSIASMCRVSLRAARAYRRKFFETVARELSAGNPAVRAVFLELGTEPPAYTYLGEGEDDEVLIPPALTEP
jgi:hypothetical protein